MPNQYAADKIVKTFVLTYKDVEILEKLSNIMANGNKSETLRKILGRFGRAMLINAEEEQNETMKKDRELLQELGLV